MTGVSALRVSEVARRLDCGEGTVRKLIRDGSLRAFRVGRLLRVSEDALAEFLNQS